MSLFAAGLALVSCTDKIEQEGPDSSGDSNGTGKPEEVKPVFPEAITQALEAGGSYTVELEPNADWSVELKYDAESTGWFWIKDNAGQFTVRGKAGEKASVTVCAGDQTDFDSVHSCTLEMTMGEETKTIATFTRGTVERTFSLVYCKVEDNGSDYMYNTTEGSDLKYEYEAAAEDGNVTIPLTWLVRTQDFRRSVLISANFDWRLKSKPEWMADLLVPSGLAGEQVEMDVEGDPMYYPLEDATGKLVFCAKDNTGAEYEFTVQIPGCRSVFSINGFSAESQANEDGEIYVRSAMGEDSWSAVDMGVTGSVLGVKGAKIYTFAYVVDDPFTGSRLWDSSADNTSWIRASFGSWVQDGDNLKWEEAAWDDNNGVLQERDLNIVITKNEEEAERQACVLVIPEDKAPAEDYMIFPDGQTMDEKYKDYVVTVLTQDAAGSEGGEGGGTVTEVEPVTFLYDHAWEDMFGTSEIASLELVTEDNLEELMTKYAKYDKLNISDYFGTTSATYILAYYSSMQSMNNLSIPDMPEWLDITCYPKGEWLTYEPMENELNIWMRKPGEDASQNFGIIQVFISMQRSYTFICLPEL